MNFFTVQSLNAYTRNMEMQMKWQKKQDTNDFTADGSMRLDNDPQGVRQRRFASPGRMVPTSLPSRLI